MTQAASLVCIIPVHNDAEHVGFAIESLLGQTLPPSRIVVVDDASTDAIEQSLAPYRHAIDYLRQPRRGPNAARNLAAMEADEEFLAFLDSDDRFDPARFSTAVAAMRADPTIGGTACLAQNVDAAGAPIGEPVPAYTCGTLVVRRSAFEQVGPFAADLQHGGALDWHVRARNAGVRIALDPMVLMYRLLRPESMSAVDPAQNHREHLQVLRATIRQRRAGAA
ncbi:glycosyltransferase family 2 protein [Flavisphingomonas formosensis]|uniref:glycosyltransferase family 2 protein n=1 Tax=Flavisphingomonas formosensis TaxID=861534 RepID=UPI0012F8F4D6|nr:glycosyltransferase family A protein [Sphingomonas formosensis]